jgi:hypothetical protein
MWSVRKNEGGKEKKKKKKKKKRIAGGQRTKKKKKKRSAGGQRTYKNELNEQYSAVIYYLFFFIYDLLNVFCYVMAEDSGLSEN